MKQQTVRTVSDYVEARKRGKRFDVKRLAENLDRDQIYRVEFSKHDVARVWFIDAHKNRRDDLGNFRPEIRTVRDMDVELFELLPVSRTPG